jgi:hypothetical protein
MGVMTFRSEEWINQNRYRAYPFVEDSNRQVVAGGLRLADNCIVDASLVSYDTNLTNLRLLALAVAPAGTTVTFTFRAATTDMTIIVPGGFSGTYEGRVLVTAGSRLLRLLRVRFAEGVPVLAATPAYQGNTYTFAAAYLEPAVSVQQLNTRVSSVNGYTGKIYFADGANSYISLLPDQNILRISAAVGAGLGVSCEPLGGGPPTSCDEALYYINGQHPDWLGRFTIRGAAGLIVDTDPPNNKLILRTSISLDKPACKDPTEI